MANRLLMIRHGEYEQRYQGSFIGKTDVPLSARGVQQAALLASPLSPLKEATFLCSPMRRTITTAQIAVGPNRHLDFDENLREIDFGLWEKMPFDEIAKGYASLVDQWAAFRDDFAFPQGESLAAFQKRIKVVADRIIHDPSGTVVVFTHGGVIRFLICRLLGIKGKHSLCFDVGTASLSEIRLYDGKGVLTLLNDRHHLDVLANEPSKKRPH